MTPEHPTPTKFPQWPIPNRLKPPPDRKARTEVVVDADEEARTKRDSQMVPGPEEILVAEDAEGAVVGIATAIPMRLKVPSGPMRLQRAKRNQRRFWQPPTMQMMGKYALSALLMSLTLQSRRVITGPVISVR